MNFCFLFLLLLSSSLCASTILPESINVNPYALPGDSERNFLPVEGVRFHEANDFYGGTDKLVSESASLSVLGTYGKYFSTSVSYKGRYVQPILKTKNGREPLSEKIGIYAEWAEVMLNQSVTLNLNNSIALKLEGGIGYNDFNNHGFADVYEAVHEAVGSPDERDKFGEKTYANFISSSLGGSIILPIGNYINIIGGYQIMNSEIFREDASSASIIWRINKAFALSATYSFIQQVRSNFYNLTNNRHQYIGAIRLFTFWTPSIMYVSPYVKGDKYGQWYLSPFSFTYPF